MTARRTVAVSSSPLKTTFEDDSVGFKKRKLSETNGGSCLTGNETKRDKNDYFYFESYADVELHRTMIEDQVRTNAYKDAIFNSGDIIKGKVVADVGCGTGILSMFCAQAGAKKVYAIDASHIAKSAKKLVELNGFQDVITVFHGKAEDVELPEKVDVIISEWMGYMLLYETMLPSVLYIREKYLKPGGKLFPERAVLQMALSETQWVTKFKESAYDFWISLNHVYNIDMCHMADQGVARFCDTVHVHMTRQEDIISLPTIICDLDLYMTTAKDLEAMSHKFSLTSMGTGLLNSFVLWFDVHFPDGSTLTTSPNHEDTHWQNTVLTLSEMRLKQDDKVKGVLNIKQSESNHRHLIISLDYNINDGADISRKFKMDDNIIDDD